MKVTSIVGARPQFIKAAPVCRELRKHVEEILVHTGQHYDYEMSELLFKELEIPEPNYNLNIGSGSHGQQTGEMLRQIETVLLSEKPDVVLVYGDTNSTLAGALAAVKLHIPVAHIEAGLRSFNRKMPEEINRIAADHFSNILFAPTEDAVHNLQIEGIRHHVYNCGDVMYDATLYNTAIAESKSDILERLSLTSGHYILSTIHRAENTDIQEHLETILEAFNQIDKTIILPLHPRTMKMLKQFNLEAKIPVHVKILNPVGYLDMLVLEKNAFAIATDSGGVQKEAYFFQVPCVTLRTETEWVETVKAGWNTIVGISVTQIVQAIHQAQYKPNEHPDFYGDGQASRKIVDLITKTFLKTSEYV